MVSPEQSSIQSSFKTTNGLKINEVYNIEESEDQPLPKGTKNYYYSIDYKKRGFTISYNVKPGETDYSETVKKVIQTVELSY